jgi:peptidoglycan/LPS O-acetylase OafA/YrhL
MDPGAVPSGGGGYARFLETKSFASLDGLRALSILAVLWHHTHGPVPGWAITMRGFLGVDLFFVVSGFLIVTLLLRERSRTGAISLRGFYVRRFLRIFPPYYGTLLLIAAIAYAKPGSMSVPLRRDLPFALLYVSNMVPMLSLLDITWSLSVEEQFYLIVPAFQKYAGPVFTMALPVAYVAVSLPPFGLFRGLGLPKFFMETTFGPILLGVMLAELLHEPVWHGRALRVLGHRFSPLVAVAVVLIAASHPAQDISGWPRMAIQWALLLLVATCVIRERHVLTGILSFWPMRRIGIVSYGIYLYHMIVRHGVNAGLRHLGISSGTWLFLATSLASWIVAELSYRLYESRFLALKERFAPDRRARRV